VKDTAKITAKLANGEALTTEETYAIFERLMSADHSLISDDEIVSYLTATAKRPLTSAEIIGAARSMRKHVVAVSIREKIPGVSLFDTAGTGGSGLQSFNTSTAAAFVIAAGGQHVAKHGNRAATSKSGSADVLAALGINLDCSPDKIANCIQKTKFGFMFAPNHHPATKRVVGIRKSLGFRTIFNFLGPLTNPAGADYQLLGVSSREMVPVIAEALLELGVKGAMVVRGEDGLDELTLGRESLVVEVRNQKIRSYTVKPEDVGYKQRPFEEISGREPQESAELINKIFDGEKSAYRELVALNAGAAFYICNKASSIEQGVRLAEQLIDAGAAKQVLKQVAELSNSRD